MHTQVDRSAQKLLWLVGAAVIAFSSAEIDAMVGWTDSLTADSNAARSISPAVTARSVMESCVDCGKIESIREILASSSAAGLVEITGTAATSPAGSYRAKIIRNEPAAVVWPVATGTILKREKSLKNHESMVRLDDGSSSRIHDTTTAIWQAGDGSTSITH